jgi:flagellar assembly protein FliH
MKGERTRAVSNIFKRLTNLRVEPYKFPDQKDLTFEDAQPAFDEEEEEPEPEAETVEEQPSEPEAVEEEAPESPAESPVDYATIQAEMILQDAHREADELLEKAKAQAEAEAKARAKEICEAAKAAGRQEGYAQGFAQAQEEGRKARAEQAAALEAEVQKFLEQATARIDRQMDDNLDDLQELALAVAEKVVCISLKSSAEVISRMIQTAIDKRKHKEWVRIYISESDAKRLTQVPPALAASLSALSERVRLIPVSDDEPGTCIIEMPDEIVDASAATQMANIRGVLLNTPSLGTVIPQV